ncbi:gliding motility-associated C-terminal domain-containing protein [Hymenobacter sp. APR13]|uniref:T9SS type B sorting domain-containing protein n=1 Tax=Hymenobacter sp. APR13 TaxID=1356852 RepID=UPI0009DD6CCD|nr:gliding motility-associated C-terminal domain-containing protein [Hymenobacter sp. APR13]
MPSLRLCAMLGLLLVIGCQKKDAQPDTTCADEDFSQSIVTPNVQLMLPNGISPNGDGLNDRFIPFAFYTNLPPVGAPPSPTFSSRTLKVYTNTGRKLVFEGLNYQSEFDGHDSQGAELPEGKYYCELTLDTNSARGTVVLVRSTKTCNCRTVDSNDDYLASRCQ